MFGEAFIELTLPRLYWYLWILSNENEFLLYRLCLLDDYKRKSTKPIMMIRRTYVFFSNAVEIIHFFLCWDWNNELNSSICSFWWQQTQTITGILFFSLSCAWLLWAITYFHYFHMCYRFRRFYLKCTLEYAYKWVFVPSSLANQFEQL